MDRLIITNATLLTGGKSLPQRAVLCENGVVRCVFPAGGPLPEGRVVDAEGRYLAPGYIDLHTHGLRGQLAEEGPGALDAISRALPEYGVTAFLPTLTPVKDECEGLAALAATKTEGATVLGFFLEGHFLALTGAIRTVVPEYTPQRAERLRAAAGGYRAVFGISPEIEGAEQLLRQMTAGGTPAFITHTAAGYEQTARAIQAGARHATHFYDVFPYAGEQEPGVRGAGTVEAIMAAPGVSVDFILDGEHVHPGAVQMALACKGIERVCLITDANVSAGMPPGVYTGISGTQVVTRYPGGPARECLPNGGAGGLVGSGLTMDIAVKNAVKLLGLPPQQAVRLAGESPARVMGLEDKMGRVEPGYNADLLLLNQDLDVTQCFVGGVCRYTK